jgi:broad specificity phosphatase PhoE
VAVAAVAAGRSAGESYLDVIQRLDPFIHELERCTDPIVIVSGDALHDIRCHDRGTTD